MAHGGAIRGRQLAVLWVGRHRRDRWEDLCSGYRERIRKVMPVRDVPVRSRGHSEDPQRLDREAEAILEAMPDPVWIVALSRRGKLQTSSRFARRLARKREAWPHPVVFVVGSDLGLGEAVLAAAGWVVSLSPMTFPHELARVMLYEQLYRAASIEAGTGYHRGLS